MGLVSHKPKLWLVLLSLFLHYVAIRSADARANWEWTDRVSCRPRRHALTKAWEEFAALADESSHVLSRPLSTEDREMLKAMYNPTINQMNDIKSRLSFLLSIKKNTGSHKAITYRIPHEDEEPRQRW